MRKRSFLLVAGACLATLSLAAAGTAIADPVPPFTPAAPQFRALPGVGSDTSQLVMNGFANGTPTFPGIGNPRTLASYDATPQPSTITTRDPATFPQCQNIPRPNGSTQGTNALQGIAPPAGFPAICASFARSSNNDSQAAVRNGANFTYIPFALDVLTFATLTQSNFPKNLSLADLGTIYSANGTPGSPACFGFFPLIPQPGSGTRGFWDTLIPGTFGTCVRDNINGVLIQEHDGTALGSNPNRIVPIGVGPWVAQSNNPLVTDRRGLSILRSINGESPFEAADFPGRRPLYNIVRNGGTTPETFEPGVAAVFVGPNSAMCTQPTNSQVLAEFALSRDPDCGSTAIRTQPN